VPQNAWRYRRGVALTDVLVDLTDGFKLQRIFIAQCEESRFQSSVGTGPPSGFLLTKWPTIPTNVSISTYIYIHNSEKDRQKLNEQNHQLTATKSVSKHSTNLGPGHFTGKSKHVLVLSKERRHEDSWGSVDIPAHINLLHHIGRNKRALRTGRFTPVGIAASTRSVWDYLCPTWSARFEERTNILPLLAVEPKPWSFIPLLIQYTD